MAQPAAQSSRRGPWLRVLATAHVNALAVGVCLLVAHRPGARAAAPDAPEAAFTLDAVTVEASPISPTEARAPTSFATTIDPAAHTEQIETVADALAESVGVSVRRFGGLGAFSTLSIRGSSANQVQIYLDGIPLSRARNESVNVADLPLDSLDRIEVYRGTVPVTFGTGGVGGVVNLVTRPPSAVPATEVSASYGSFDTRKVVATHSRQLHGVDLLGSVTYLGSEGDFRFPNDNGTPLNPADDFTDTRRNNEFNSVDALLKAGYALRPGLYVDVTSETFYKDQGVPGLGQSQSRTASLTDLRTVNYLRLRTPRLRDGTLDASGALFGEFEQVEFTDREGKLGAGAQDRCDRTSVGGGQATGTWTLAPWAATAHTLTGFIEVSHERFAPYNALARPSDQPDQTRLRATAALQDQAAWLGDRIVLLPAVRFEYLDDRVSASFSRANEPTGPSETHTRELWSPSIGVALRPWAPLTVKGNLARIKRAPNFSELFGFGASVVGNSQLRPETAVNRDVGVVLSGAPWPLDTARLEYAYFNNDVDDIIVFVQSGTRVAKPFNVSAARIRGHEVTAGASALGHLRADVNYTHQDAENRGTLFGSNYRGKQLPGRPEDELYTRIEAFAPLGKLYYELNYLSGNFLDPINFQAVPSRDVHTVGAAWNARQWARLSFEARNLTDNHISDVGGFPLPGRSYFGSVSLTF